ncbi:CinA family protein [Alterisphingorhabdus coralli]|uniref:CinA family protein n=1 Tax=Alterisphingorhabdus coralli TaxID=3071408 RepID=A0AA97I050_9SPHN|nr:CinA family protein [Parasphingorhabdus sp. SCSIO 66989]WOE74058.1 CinA family protein [Parasphingorhabdus sp. SCSIO 66989]
MTELLPDNIAALAEQVLDSNREAGRRIAVAESCTGGLVAAALTEWPGSSEVFERGYVTYSNAAKQEELGVSSDIIDAFGAVSIAVAWAMAKGALQKSGADIAVSITGVAGPGGGTEKKPVGTVVFACIKKGDDPDKVVAELKRFGEDLSRDEIRRQAALCALELFLP